MTTERQRQEWEYFERTVLPAYIDRLVNLEEQKTDIDLKKKDIIQEIADRVESAGWIPPESISAYLKKVLKGVVADRTIEDALGKKHKRKYESLPSVGNPQSADIDHKKEIEVSSRGMSNLFTGEPAGDEPEDDVPPESDDKPLFYEGEPDIPLIDVSAELGLTEIIALKQEKEDLTLRLEEALKLADDKDKALERERIQNANLEVELGEAKKNEAAALSKPANHRGPTMEELQIKYDELRAEYAELLEVERLRTSKSDFKSAATLPKQCYVYAVDAINFFVPLKKAKDWAMDHSDPWKKILFEVGPDGQLKAAQFEEPVNDQS